MRSKLSSDLLRRGVVERALGNLGLDVVDLQRVLEVGGAGAHQRAPLDPGAGGVLAGQLVEPGEAVGDRRQLERGAHVDGQLVGAAVALEPDPVGRPDRGEVADRDDDPADPEAAGEEPGVDGAGAAEGVEVEVARVVAACDGHAADLVRHQAVGDLRTPGRALEHARPSCSPSVAIAARAASTSSVIRPPRKLSGFEQAEHEVGVGDGRHGAAAAVTGRSGVGAGALGPDAERAGLRVDPGEAAAAGADRLDVDDAQEEVVLSTTTLSRIGSAPSEMTPTSKRRPAHVGGDDVSWPSSAPALPAGDDAADRAGLERHHRRAITSSASIRPPAHWAKSSRSP